MCHAGACAQDIHTPAPQVAIHHALFVPPDSTYSKLGASQEPVNLSWQHALRSVWEANGGSAGGGAAAARAVPAPAPQLPPLPAASASGAPAPAGACAGARGALLPSLQVTLDWLRNCVREAPALRMRVLVTGSLYLVGDLLKQLQQPQVGGSGGAGSS